MHITVKTHRIRNKTMVHADAMHCLPTATRFVEKLLRLWGTG
jgi:hypothetical protein